MHFVDTDLVQQWDEKRGTCSTVDEVDAWFLDAYGGGGMEEKHAVYTMADVKLSVVDAFQPFVDRFIDTFMAANPNTIRNDRITSFINALYPEMREALEIEPAFSEWNDLAKRTEHLHAKLQKKARAKLAAVQSTQSASDLERWEKLTDRLERVEASIAALHTRGRGRGNSMPRGGRGGYAVYGNRPSPQVAYGFTPGRNAGSGWRGRYRGRGGMPGGVYRGRGGHNGFNNNSPVVPAILALSAAGGSGLKVLGETTISLSHPNNPEKKFLHTLLVTADTGYNLVLGQDFLKLKDPVVQYHYREDRLVVADLPVFYCWYDDGRKLMRVAPLQRTKVTKRSRALLRVDVDGVGEEETVILR
uniref:Uncharacterized protein n=1 Tax=Chromera velia CCMP2878 TaxID=1169474 RepID=A0A0G4H045_9ALVE|eukprot:Cvel_24108.t1-p1 / transcript=Cvel_24108.t1 / gene=Cvel_24108 / organism=Chromera_velia_CCMP2878 / gene_product=hypothetical protein / transcript_product=hypothetical protein / location=Cvel_scaffold2568:177-1733(-) / protein_length=359 / sequence_SO=supercontig / SO=protein_coding / is_pseudo=false